MIEVLKQALDYIDNVPDDRDNVGHIDRRALVFALNQAIAELESQDGACQHCAGKGCVACDARKQEPVACKECHLKDTVYDLLGDLKVANLKLSVRSQRTWVGLTDEEIQEITLELPMDAVRITEAKLKEKNNDVF